MRQSADWMRAADNRVLEIIRSDGNMTPLALSKEGLHPRVDITRKYAGVRCRELYRYGLLCKIDRGLYGITQAGLDYLNEDLDASTLSPRD